MMEIASTGMVTAVGNDAQSSCTAIRAGITGFREIPFQFGGLPVIGALARNATGAKAGIHLLGQLAHMAIAECAAGLEMAKVPLLLAIAQPESPGTPRTLGERLLRGLTRLLNTPLHSDSAVFAQGTVSGISALARARELLASGRVDSCLVCGVDSLINAPMLDTLFRHQRIKHDANPDGLIPGEAAACVLVTRPGRVSSQRGTVIRGLGFGRETAHVTSSEPVLGVGLSAAIKEALDDASMTMNDIDFRISSITGERYGFIEANYALARVLRTTKGTFEFLHLMDTIGVVGAAAAPCQLAYLKFMYERGCVPATGALCETSSDDGRRAVAIVAPVNS